ncbi:hypothetical protein [Mesorhizobium sp.]|uniref:hypothetical protein n=1 Tax=Mesorhizobium sp. TaxID=1871066 RepID=UPI0025E9E8A5|nr:hypothetical protein [Mesorhizobium sp.]
MDGKTQGWRFRPIADHGAAPHLPAGIFSVQDREKGLAATLAVLSPFFTGSG